MSITVAVDSVTFLISRVLTAAVFVGIGAVVALMAGEKARLPKKPLRFLVALVGLGAGIAAFLAGWASVKVSIGVGLGMMIFGISLGFDKGAERRGGPIALLAAGAAWVGWNIYLMIR
jgi:hypothetical protein